MGLLSEYQYRDPDLSKEVLENRETFLNIAKDFFDKNGTKLDVRNGRKLPLDLEMDNKTGLEGRWSINVYVLTDTGINYAYFRNNSNVFTSGNKYTIMDLYLKHIRLISKKFITEEQLEELTKLTSHLKLF